MNPGAEGQVTQIAAEEVEAVGFRKVGGVPVRGAEEQHDQRASRDPVTGHVHVRLRDPPGSLHGALPTERLFDRRLVQNGT